MSKVQLPLSLFLLTVTGVAVLALFGPEEKSVGAHVRIVYLHGAWVVTSELVLFMALFAGLVGLTTRHKNFHAWSGALGRAGTFFWITSLPLSLWAMQANWNGLFLAEPRFRVAVIFSVSGLLLQAGLWSINADWLTSFMNIIYLATLGIYLAMTQNVMHPSASPIFDSGNYLIIGFFVAMILLLLLAAIFLARVFMLWRPAQKPGSRPV